MYLPEIGQGGQSLKKLAFVTKYLRLHFIQESFQELKKEGHAGLFYGISFKMAEVNCNFQIGSDRQDCFDMLGNGIPIGSSNIIS